MTNIFLNVYNSILCAIGIHKWKLISGSRKQTGFAIGYCLTLEHEIQEEETCSCCGLHRTVYGKVDPLRNHLKDEFPKHDDGRPLDKNGNILPSYISIGKTSSYSWHPSPTYKKMEK